MSTYDRHFETAVADGFLTVREARERGNRRAYADDLEQRYSLPPVVALQVADNRVRLREALEKLDRLTAPPIRIPKPPRPFPWDRIVGAVAIACVVLALGHHVQRLWSDQVAVGRELELASFAAIDRLAAQPAQTLSANPGSGVAVQRDELGRITRVSAGKPASVLETLCRIASGSTSCVWMELEKVEPRQAGRRVGRFVDAIDGITWAVVIRRDLSSGRWLSGTGLRPIVPVPEADPRFR